MSKIIWLLRIIASFILLQTLFFKFTGAPESIYIFKTLGVEPFGRIASGVIELIVAILILIPVTSKLGSIGAIGVILGAIASHLFILGIEVQGDGGLLFMLAVAVLVTSILNVVLTKKKIGILGL